MSGVAFSQLGTSWPKAYQDALFFSDFLRGCIWRLEKGADGQPDPASVRVFAQAAGSPVDLTTGPGGDLYYVDYGIVNGDSSRAPAVCTASSTPAPPTSPSSRRPRR